MYRPYLLLFLFCGLFLLPLQAQKDKTNTIEKAITKHGQAFVRDKGINSVSIGIFKAGKRYSQHFGELEKGKGNTPTDETIYEIGSVTKTMTGYLVAKAVLEQKISISDDVRRYLDGDFPNLVYNDKPITIQQLMTHTSGLPMFLPTTMNGLFEQGGENVPTTYFDLEKSYNKDRFFKDLKEVDLTYEPGTVYSYSNAGAELIGHVLETVYQKDIDILLREGFLDEYGMANTAIKIDEIRRHNLTQGYWMNNTTPSPNQLNTLWATGGGAKMNMLDMLSYMALQLNGKNPVVVESHRVLYEGEKLLRLGYFWRVWKDKYGTSYNHHGGTSGMQNWLFIFPKYDLGISIITNQSGFKTPNKLSSTAKKLLKAIVKD